MFENMLDLRTFAGEVGTQSSRPLQPPSKAGGKLLVPPQHAGVAAPSSHSSSISSGGGDVLSPESRDYIAKRKLQALFRELIDSTSTFSGHSAGRTEAARGSYLEDGHGQGVGNGPPRNETELRVHLMKFLARRQSKAELEAMGVTFAPVNIDKDTNVRHACFDPSMVNRAARGLNVFDEGERVREQIEMSAEEADAWFINVFDGLANEDGLASRRALRLAFYRVSGRAPPKETEETEKQVEVPVATESNRNSESAVLISGTPTPVGPSASTKLKERDGIATSLAQESQDDPVVDDLISFPEFLTMIFELERKEREEQLQLQQHAAARTSNAATTSS
ncbi:unnamed protein product [Amoebophrya sp. A25]|nr:unnamed protein product [Amoebophrya sp. A25]|eukprot:GSA25T00013479001.1